MSSRIWDSDLCTTWLYSPQSQVHIAKDRGWFTQYRPISSYILGENQVHGRINKEVVGIGMVDIPVKRFPKDSGRGAHDIFRLHLVLHVPTAICNVFGGRSNYPGGVPAWVSMVPQDDCEGEVLESATSRRMACFYRPASSGGLPLLRLSGYPVGPRAGPSPLPATPGSVIVNPWFWPEAERGRWLAKQPNQQRLLASGDVSYQVKISTNSAEMVQSAVVEEGYTVKEKRWLKDHWGNKYKFLRAHALNIYKDEHREEGRTIVRSMMAEEEEDAKAQKQKEALDAYFANRFFIGCTIVGT